MEELPAKVLDNIFGYVCIPNPTVNKHIYASTKYSFLSHPNAINLVDSNFYNIIYKCFGEPEHVISNRDLLDNIFGEVESSCREPLFFRRVISCILDNIDWYEMRCKDDIYTCITDDILFSEIFTTDIGSYCIIESEIEKRTFRYGSYVY